MKDRVDFHDGTIKLGALEDSMCVTGGLFARFGIQYSLIQTRSLQ